MFRGRLQEATGIWGIGELSANSEQTPLSDCGLCSEV